MEELGLGMEELAALGGLALDRGKSLVLITFVVVGIILGGATGGTGCACCI